MRYNLAMAGLDVIATDILVTNSRQLDVSRQRTYMHAPEYFETPMALVLGRFIAPLKGPAPFPITPAMVRS